MFDQGPQGAAHAPQPQPVVIVPAAQFEALVAKVEALERHFVQLEQERKVADDERLLTIREIERLPELRVRRPALMAAYRDGTLACEVRRYGKRKVTYLFRYSTVMRRFCSCTD